MGAVRMRDPPKSFFGGRIWMVQGFGEWKVSRRWRVDVVVESANLAFLWSTAEKKNQWVDLTWDSMAVFDCEWETCGTLHLGSVLELVIRSDTWCCSPYVWICLIWRSERGASRLQMGWWFCFAISLTDVGLHLHVYFLASWVVLTRVDMWVGTVHCMQGILSCIICVCICCACIISAQGGMQCVLMHLEETCTRLRHIPYYCFTVIDWFNY